MADICLGVCTFPLGIGYRIWLPSILVVHTEPSQASSGATAHVRPENTLAFVGEVDAVWQILAHDDGREFLRCEVETQDFAVGVHV